MVEGAVKNKAQNAESGHFTHEEVATAPYEA